jgi:hypothetical protein
MIVPALEVNDQTADFICRRISRQSGMRYRGNSMRKGGGGALCGKVRLKIQAKPSAPSVPST